MEGYVGPYRILRLIRRGGQGSVYLGYDRRLHRRVAIKIYRLPGARAGRRQLLREARLVAALECPRIVPVHDVIESSGHLAMVMEYVSGCSLEDVLAATRPALASAMTVGIDIAGALAIARQRGIVHGDVKAGNVLVDVAGRAHLTDFGISQPVQPGGALVLAGSPEALSPEQCAGEPLTEQADFFSLGLLLYRMLGGAHPFYDHGRLNTVRLLRGEPRPLGEVLADGRRVPAPLLALLDQLLQRDPGQRPRHTRGMRQVMRGVLRDIPMASHRSLLFEARPLFRAESPEDIPPRIPGELGREGRSRLPPSGGRLARLAHWLRGLRTPGRAALALCVAALVAAPLVVALQQDPTRVSIRQPSLRIDADIDVPPGLSSRWLRAELEAALAARFERLRLVGRFGDRPGPHPLMPEPPAAPPAVDHHVAVTVRCLESFCLMQVSRSSGGELASAQSVLLPHMSLPQWRATLAASTASLFP
ncbi:MAG: hypothetical protein CME59_19105 [Halioglobus sp.]|nr:hypothetical protein [Halioglobus sp.]